MIERMDVTEFRTLGYLQEVNRRFLHPLGLALEVVIDDDGSERLGGIWDYRDDPEGMQYGRGVIDVGKVTYVEDQEDARLHARCEALGYWIQPL